MKPCVEILYLEDDSLDVDLIRAILTSSREITYKIDTASNQATYKRLLSKKEYDIILSDYQIPDYSGVEALKYLSSIENHTPFILLSGAIGDELAVKVMKLGAFDYILKNHLEKLPLVIKRALESNAQRREKYQWESMFHTIEKASLAGFFRLDKAGKYIYTNKFFLEMFGCTREELANLDWLSVFSHSDGQAIQSNWAEIAYRYRVYEKIFPFTSVDGRLKWIHLHVLPEFQGKRLSGYVGVVFDVTAVKETEAKLAYTQRYDEITSLFNKKGFERELESYVERHQAFNAQEILLFININDFKRINNSLGHSIGDDVLRKVANRIAKHYGEKAVLARFNNDTFAVFLPAIQRGSEVTQLIESLNCYLLKHPIRIKKERFVIVLTTGVVELAKAGKTIQEILQHADQTLNYAKKEHRSGYCFYSDIINKKIIRTSDIEHSLRYGLENDELFLVYQPQIDIKRNKVVGIEALCRWKSNTLGDVSPSEFIPYAETTDIIIPLTEYLCKKFFCDMESWFIGNDILFKDVTASFNLSACILTANDILDFILSEIRRSNVEPRSICFEVTETGIMQNKESAKFFLEKLSSEGFRLSIDDFGTGQTSLNYLRSLPVNEIKIDKSFIANIQTTKSDYKLIKAILHLANILKLHVVAEGVETKEQLDLLRKLDCSTIQGFYYSRPILPQQLLTFIQQFHTSETDR